MSLNDAQLAAELAAEAGRILLDLRANGGLEGKILGEAGDRLANRYLMDRLAAAFESVAPEPQRGGVA